MMMCSASVAHCAKAKRALFTVLRSIQLVVQLQQSKDKKKLQVVFNDTFRILLRLQRWTQVMFVTSDVLTFHAVLRN